MAEQNLDGPFDHGPDAGGAPSGDGPGTPEAAAPAGRSRTGAGGTGLPDGGAPPAAGATSLTGAPPAEAPHRPAPPPGPFPDAADAPTDGAAPRPAADGAAPAGPAAPDPATVRRAERWLAEDPDPDTRAELSALLRDAAAGAEDAAADLADRFSGLLRFGTAGLRGELGAGPNRMNRAVVIRTAAGLAAYLKRHADPDAAAPGLVVIGYDARHRSADFAHDTAAVLVGAGMRAAVLPRPLPTPVLAFAIRQLGAVAGVQVTASHNPPRDNGYKVYVGDGAQIAPPADTEIAADIDAVGPLGEVPRAPGGWRTLDADAPDGVLTAYLDRTRHVLDPHSSRDLRTVYTPLHGVGRDVLAEAFTRNGFPAPSVVAEQSEPDPDFPTVSFPNPEEPGALDLAFRLAADVHPDLVIANDPDADRCAVAVPDPSAPLGWRTLRGDDVGALLATGLMRRCASGTFATTIVSSSLLGKLAEHAGLRHAETLTGFKWLARVEGLRYAYEEALGYCVDPDGVRDKDGITAALLVAELAAELKAQGRTVADLLDDLATRFGVHATDQLSLRVDDLSLIAGAMRRLRAHPPRELAGLSVARVDDLADSSPRTDGLPPSDGLRLTLAGDPPPPEPADGSFTGEGAPYVSGARVIVRPSGTEPKLKCYLEAVVPMPAGSILLAARELADTVLARVKQDLSAAIGL